MYRHASCKTADSSTAVPCKLTVSRVQVSVKSGHTVKAGQVVAVMSAMKMETTVGAPCNGIVTHVAVINKDLLDAGDLLLRISEEDSGATSVAADAVETAAA
jgi:3-methylcrotonyl-CoA carboxylase alpha subunit